MQLLVRLVEGLQLPVPVAQLGEEPRVLDRDGSLARDGSEECDLGGARQLALAHHLQAAIERGLVADQAALARKLGLTRARVTQLFDLLMLAADLQEQVLALEAVDGAEPMAERTLREVAHAGTWAEQRAAWAKLLPCATQNR